jgi:hypothetical protein
MASLAHCRVLQTDPLTPIRGEVYPGEASAPIRPPVWVRIQGQSLASDLQTELQRAILSFLYAQGAIERPVVVTGTFAEETAFVPLVPNPNQPSYEPKPIEIGTSDAQALQVRPWEMTYRQYSRAPIVLFRGLVEQGGRRVDSREVGLFWTPFFDTAYRNRSDGVHVYRWTPTAEELIAAIQPELDVDREYVFPLWRNPIGVTQLSPLEIAEWLEHGKSISNAKVLNSIAYRHENGIVSVYRPLPDWLAAVAMALAAGHSVSPEIMADAKTRGGRFE